MSDDVVINKAAAIERCLKRVREDYVGHEEELDWNFTRQDAIVLNLQRACETAIDLASYTIRKNRLGMPQTSRDVFQILAKAKIISEELSLHLQKMVGFRNIAVHEYQQLKLSVIRFIIGERLSDFEAFIHAMLKNPL